MGTPALESAQGGLSPRRSRTLRIAYISIGRHIHTERWLRFFAQRGFDVHLLTGEPGPIEGVTVHDLGSLSGVKPVRYGLRLLGVRRLLARLRPDLLHVHFLTGYGYLGAFSGFHPFLLTVWGDDVYVTPHENPVKRWLARYTLARADWVSGDSNDILEAAVALGARRDRTQLVQWGVDFEQFHPGVESDVRRQLGLPAEAPVVLSTRSFRRAYYNIELIVDAIPEVLARRPDTVFVIAGYEGSDEAIRARVDRLGVAHAVRFLGRIPHDRLPAVLAASDVFLTVPSVDATAVSLLEAMATGCAVIASALPSAMEWVRDGESGVLVPPGEKEPLVAAIVDLILRPEERRRLGQNAVEIVRQRADHGRNMGAVEAVYRRFAAGDPVAVASFPEPGTLRR